MSETFHTCIVPVIGLVNVEKDSKMLRLCCGYGHVVLVILLYARVSDTWLRIPRPYTQTATLPLPGCLEETFYLSYIFSSLYAMIRLWYVWLI